MNLCFKQVLSWTNDCVVRQPFWIMDTLVGWSRYKIVHWWVQIFETPKISIPIWKSIPPNSWSNSILLSVHVLFRLRLTIYCMSSMHEAFSWGPDVISNNTENNEILCGGIHLEHRPCAETVLKSLSKSGGKTVYLVVVLYLTLAAYAIFSWSYSSCRFSWGLLTKAWWSLLTKTQALVLCKSSPQGCESLSPCRSHRLSHALSLSRSFANLISGLSFSEDSANPTKNNIQRTLSS